MPIEDWQRLGQIPWNSILNAARLPTMDCRICFASLKLEPCTSTSAGPPSKDLSRRTSDSCITLMSTCLMQPNSSTIRSTVPCAKSQDAASRTLANKMAGKRRSRWTSISSESRTLQPRLVGSFDVARIGTRSTSSARFLPGTRCTIHCTSKICRKRLARAKRKWTCHQSGCACCFVGPGYRRRSRVSDMASLTVKRTSLHLANTVATRATTDRLLERLRTKTLDLDLRGTRIPRHEVERFLEKIASANPFAS